MLKQVHAIVRQEGKGEDCTTSIVQVYDFELLARLDCQKYFRSRAEGVLYYVVPVNLQCTTAEERDYLEWCRRSFR